MVGAVSNKKIIKKHKSERRQTIMTAMTASSTKTQTKHEHLTNMALVKGKTPFHILKRYNL